MIIKQPHITEKTIALAETQNKYTFEVDMTASKVSAAKELQDMFGVTVKSVKTHTRLGKTTRFGKARKPAKRSDRKFMVFKLKDGDKIETFNTK